MNRTDSKDATESPQGDRCATRDGSADLSTAQQTPNQRRGLLAGVAAGAAAVVASACCWLPPVLIALGIGGAAGVGTFFEGARPFMLVLVAVLLLVLFRRAFSSRAACVEGEACATDAGRPRARRMFWSVAMAALVFTTYPYWGAALQGGAGAEASDAAFARAAKEGRLLEVRITGLTCAACAATARKALVALPAVEDASVDAKSGEASIVLRDGEDLDRIREEVESALRTHGYGLAPDADGRGP